MAKQKVEGLESQDEGAAAVKILFEEVEEIRLQELRVQEEMHRNVAGLRSQAVRAHLTHVSKVPPPTEEEERPRPTDEVSSAVA
eukprot:40572-Karenia_brevis.AAC.1